MVPVGLRLAPVASVDFSVDRMLARPLGGSHSTWAYGLGPGIKPPSGARHLLAGPGDARRHGIAMLAPATDRSNTTSLGTWSPQNVETPIAFWLGTVSGSCFSTYHVAFRLQTTQS